MMHASHPLHCRRAMGTDGFTLVEIMIAVAVLSVGMIGVMDVFYSVQVLNEHSRHMTWAASDANRVLERMREENNGCLAPSADPADGAATWDAWLTDTGGGKSIQPDPATNELVTVTSSGTDPLTVTVMVCWRHRTRVIGECAWDGTALSTSDLDEDGTLESPVMMSTLMSCH